VCAVGIALYRCAEAGWMPTKPMASFRSLCEVSAIVRAKLSDFVGSAFEA
jgi:hypothetical protein